MLTESVTKIEYVYPLHLVFCIVTYSMLQTGLSRYYDGEVEKGYILVMFSEFGWIDYFCRLIHNNICD